MFGEVFCAKPKSCRNSSIEAFVVAKGFKGAPLQKKELSPLDVLTTLNHLQNFSAIYSGEEEEDEGEMVPFVACGGEGDFDPDMNYNLST